MLLQLDLRRNAIGSEGEKPLADALRLNASVTSIDLSSNNLARETDYIKASKVQGTSFNVGDKVVYQGREMTISKGKDRDGDIKMIDLSGVKELASAIGVNASITQVLALN